MIVQNSQPKKIRRSNKIRKIIKDGIVLNFSKTNDLIQKYGDNSKQIKRTNYTKYITKGNNYYFSKYLELRNIDVLYNFCSIKGQSVLIDLIKKLNNDNELIKQFDKKFEIFLLVNEFPFSKKFKEMHNYNYINDNKYSNICLDEINCGKKSKEKSNEIKIFPNLNVLIDNNKNNDNNNNIFNNNFYSESDFHLFNNNSQLFQKEFSTSDYLNKKKLLNKKSIADDNFFEGETGESTKNKNDDIDNIYNFNHYNDLILDVKSETNSLSYFQSENNSEIFNLFSNKYN